MDIGSLLKHLFISILSSIALFFLFNAFLDIWKYKDLLVYSILFFTVIKLSLYLLGKLSMHFNKSTMFLGVVAGNVFFKLIASVVFISIYVSKTHPQDKFFFIPFFIVYLSFTILETIMLNRMARETK